MGEHSVTDVCMEVGFSSLGSFSTLFTRRLGEAPSAYQRRVRTSVQVPGGLPAVLAPGCLSLMSRLPPSAFPRPLVAVFEKRLSYAQVKVHSASNLEP